MWFFKLQHRIEFDFKNCCYFSKEVTAVDVFREPLLVCEILVSLQLCLLWENVYLPQLIDVVLDVMSFKSMSPQMIFF